MHIIDRTWSELAAGYQAIQLFKEKLTAEFGRAVQVGRKQHFRKELTEWQKKRRVFIALAAFAPLSIIALCLTAFYFREVACVIVYWAVLVMIILVTLAVAGRQYINEMVNGKPVPQTAEGLAVDLEGRWWESLSLQEKSIEVTGAKGEADFKTLLARSLPDPYVACLLPDGEMLLLGPSGIWFFKVVDWSGMILKQDGVWKQRDKRGAEAISESAPDEQWLKQKQAMEKLLKERLPERDWILSLIRGGVVFSHPKASPDRKRIQGNTASYGSAKAWAERVRQAPAVDGFTTDMQLEILDALAERGDQQPASAKDEAQRLYQRAVDELRSYVANLVK
jgi:hypothetical protein